MISGMTSEPMSNEPMSIFVTGSGGIVGRHMLDALAELAPRARVWRNDADLTDPAAIRATLAGISAQGGGIDLVIHLAALVPVAQVRSDPARAFAVNVAGTINLLQGLGPSGARMLLCSTGHVYQSSADALNEDAPKVPLSLYGQSKYMAEQAAEAICAATGRALCTGRLFSIHDPAQEGTFLRPALEARLREHAPGTPFELPGADSERDFLPAREAAWLLARLALGSATGAVNVASGIPTLVRDFAQSLSPIPLDIRPVGTPDRLVADVTRLRGLLGENHV